MSALDELVHDALITTAAIALPVLTVAAAVGMAIAVLQAATQVQEQTLTLLPKIVVIGLMVALFGASAMHLLARLFNEALTAIPALQTQW